MPRGPSYVSMEQRERSERDASIQEAWDLSDTDGHGDNEGEAAEQMQQGWTRSKRQRTAPKQPAARSAADPLPDDLTPEEMEHAVNQRRDKGKAKARTAPRT